MIIIFANKSSIFVHAADTYLHVATEAVNLVQILPQAPSEHQYGRNIDPWCLDNHETMGTTQNKNFWGCTMTSTRINDTNDASDFNNMSELVTAVNAGYGNGFMNFTDETGTKYAVLGPATSPSEVDWQATSFALSSQCVPVSPATCDFHTDPDSYKYRGMHNLGFNCSIARGSPIDFSGYLRGNALSYAFFDFHKYLEEQGTLFRGLSLVSTIPSANISNVTEEEATHMFPSTWSWVASVAVMNSSEDMADLVWPGTYDDYMDMVVVCNTTGMCPLPRSF
jgi:hypothetical protein